jgi:hypothetical protein
MSGCAEPNACAELQRALEQVQGGQSDRLESAIWRDETSGPLDDTLIKTTQERGGDFRYSYDVSLTRQCLGPDWREIQDEHAITGWFSPATRFVRSGWPNVIVFEDRSGEPRGPASVSASRRRQVVIESPAQ